MLRRQPPVIIRDTRTEYVDRNITINRAPTDQSVALLREMEQKAEAEVVKAVRVGDNGFDCVVQKILDEASDAVIWRAVFSLNGKRMTAEFSAPSFAAQDIGRMAAGLRDEAAKAIAGEVLTAGFSHLRL